MLKTIFVENFQKHKKLKIPISNGTTVIVGKSDCGKSSIMRAFRIALRNEPLGIDSFIKHGEKGFLISVTTDKGKIKRIRSKSENIYKVNDKTLEAFGIGIPPPVLEVFRTSEDNFQTQHEPSFWFSLSESEVSRQLNEIINLEVMDNSVSEVLSMKRETETKLKMTEEEIQNTREELTKLRGVKEQKEIVERLINLEKEMRENQELVSWIQNQFEHIEFLQEKIKITKAKLEEIASIESLIQNEERLAKEKQEVQKERDNIKFFVDSVEGLNAQIKRLQDEIQKQDKHLTKIYAKKVYCPVCKQFIPPKQIPLCDSVK